MVEHAKPDTDLKDKADAQDPKQGLDKLVPNLQVSEGNQPMKLDTTKRESKSGRYVKYNGVGTVRIMDESAWRSVQVDSDRYFEWNALNRKRIPLEAFNDKELQYLLRVDDRFEIVEN